MEKAKVASTTPKMEKLEGGKTYAQCACGKSENQPWCNGAHADSEFTPNVFKAEKSKDAAICMCKQKILPIVMVHI